MFKRIALIVSAVTFMFSTSAYAKTVEFIIDKPTYASIDKYEKETNALLAALLNLSGKLQQFYEFRRIKALAVLFPGTQMQGL